MSGDGAELPVRPVQAWTDGRGNLYPTKEAALLVEIERVLGHSGATSADSLVPGIARLIASKRTQLVPLLEALGPETVDSIEPISLDAIRRLRGEDKA